MGCVHPPQKISCFRTGSHMLKKGTYLSQPLPRRLNSNACLLENACGHRPCLLQETGGWFPLTVSTLVSSMREFLDFRGCPTHILLLNQKPFSPISSTAQVVKWRWHNLQGLGGHGLSAKQSDDSLRNIPGWLRPRPKPSQFWPQWGILALHSHVYSGLVQIFLSRSILYLPLWESTVTTNVPMDGNDPRGWRDWQRAEWDQRLKGLRRGEKACQRSKNKKHVAKNAFDIGAALSEIWEPHPPQNYACSLTLPHPNPWTAGAGQAWGPACSWVRSLLPHARPSYAGNRPS